MYTFEFNDNLRYRTREALADELRELADRIESGCNYLPSCRFNNVAGWIHKDHYSDEDSDEEDYMEDEEDYMEDEEGDMEE